MPVYSGQRVTSVNPGGGGGGFGQVDLGALAKGQAQALDNLYRDKVKEVENEAKSQVRKEGLANPTGFLREIGQDPTDKNVFRNTLRAEIRTENVLRGENALKIYAAQAISALGDVDNPDSEMAVPHEIADQQLALFDKRWQENIYSVIGDEEALNLLSKKYQVMRADLGLKIQQAKEKSRNIRIRETAEQTLNIVVEGATPDDMETIGMAVKVASSANPSRLSDYYKQGTSAFMSMMKPENINNYYSEMAHKFVAEKMSPEQTIQAMMELRNKKMGELMEFNKMYPGIIPNRGIKNFQEASTNAIFDTATDVFILPALQQQAEVAITAPKKPGEMKPKDKITAMKAGVSSVVMKYGKRVERQTGGAITSSEFQDNVLPRINNKVAHLSALASAMEQAQNDRITRENEGIKAASDEIVRRAKEGVIYEGAADIMSISAGEIEAITQAAKEGRINPSEDFMNIAEVLTTYRTNDDRNNLMTVMNETADRMPDATPEAKAATVMDRLDEVANFTEDKKRKLMRGIALRFEGVDNEFSVNPTLKKFQMRGVTPVRYSAPVYADGDKTPLAEKLQGEQAAFNQFYQNYQQRKSVIRANEDDDIIDDNEKDDLRRMIARIAPMDKGDQLGIQRTAIGLLAEDGDALGVMRRHDSEFQTYRIEPLPALESQVMAQIATYPGLANNKMFRSLASTIPWEIANDQTIGGLNWSEEGDPNANSSVIKSAIARRVVPGHPMAVAARVNYQSDFSVFGGYSFFDERKLGVPRWERDPAYLMDLISGDATFLGAPKGVDEFVLDDSYNGELSNLMDKVRNGSVQLVSLPPDPDGNNIYAFAEGGALLKVDYENMQGIKRPAEILAVLPFDRKFIDNNRYTTNFTGTAGKMRQKPTPEQVARGGL